MPDDIIVPSGSGGAFWVDVPFNAADFVGGGTMTWTVQAADVEANRYMMLAPNLMLWALHVNTTDIGGTPTNLLTIAIPNNKKARIFCGDTCLITNNSVENSGRYLYNVGDEVISLFQQLPVTAFTAGTGVCGVIFVALLDVENA